MEKFAVPVWVRQRAMLEVEAESLAEAIRTAAEKKGKQSASLIGADINGLLTIDGVRRTGFDGEPVKVRRLSNADIAWMTGRLGENIDNDKGVPFEDYGPDEEDEED